MAQADGSLRRVGGATVRVWATIAALLCLAGLLSSCGGDDEPAASKRSRSTTTEATDDGDAEPPSSTVPATTTTSKLGDTIDVSKAPPVVLATSDSVWYFEDLMDAPERRVGPIANRGESYEVSPDGTRVATITPGDAIRPTNVELLEVESGESLASFDIQADTAALYPWSPDSEAVMARATQSNSEIVVYRADGTSEVTPPLVNRLPAWVRGTGPTSAVTCEDCYGVQLTDSSLRPVALGLLPAGGGTGRYDPETDAFVPFPGQWGTSELSAEACAEVTTMTGYVGSDAVAALYSVDLDTVIQVEELNRNYPCPLPSPDGTLAAVVLASGGAAVVDLESGELVTVARQGVPVAWSADGEKVLVQGNGTFTVAADGSGGKESSVQLGVMCAVGETGTVLAQATNPTTRANELVLYDIGKDSSSVVSDRLPLGDTCQLSGDGNWLLTDGVLVDLKSKAATTLRRSDDEGNGLSGTFSFLTPRALTSRARV